MYNDNPAPRARLLSLLVAAACAGIALPAAADPSISLTAVYALDGAAEADAMAEDSFTPPTTGGDYYGTKYGSGSSVFFHTYGFTSSPTYFGARASGEGLDFYAKTSALYSGSYTNMSGSAMALTFSFNLDGGEVGLWGTGNGSSNLRLQIRRNGSVVSQGDTLITQVGGTVSCSESDIGALGAWASCAAADANSAWGAGGAYSVDMGLVAAGETITIDYDIIATVSGQYIDGAQSSGSCNNYGGYAALRVAEGGEGVEQPYVPCVNFNGIARSGDPFNGNEPFVNADFLLTATAADLPEPGSLALLAAAGGGMWLTRRRRGAGSAS